MKKILLSLLLVLGLCGSAWAAITYDASSSGARAYYEADTTLTWSHSVGSGTDRYLVVAVATDDESITCSTITYNGDSMTEVLEQGAQGVHPCIYYLANPDSGTHNIVATVSASSDIAGGAISLAGVDQGAPDDSDYNSVVRSPSITLTTGADNSWIVDVATSGNQNMTFSAGASQTDRVNHIDSGTSRIAMSHKTIASAGSGTTSWTGNDDYGAVALSVALAPAEAAATCDTDCTLCETFATCLASGSSCFYFDEACSETAGTFKTEIK